MKSKILIIIALCFVKTLFAQDTLRIETVVDTAFKTPQYVAAYDDVFLSHKETKWLLKADLVGALGGIFEKDRTVRPTSFEFERKIQKTMSLNMGISTFFELADIIDKPSGDKVQSFEFYVEPRFFLSKNQHSNKVMAVNNLNGNYFSFRAGFTKNYLELSQYGDNGYFPKILLDKYKLSVNYGLQRRVFNNFYVNYRLGVGLTNYDVLTAKIENINNAITRIPTEETHFSFDNHFTIGLAFGGGKRLATNNLCDLFRCFEEEQQLFKMDVKGLLNSLEKKRISSNLSLGYEHKLGQSSFSINIDWFGKYDYYNRDYEYYGSGILEKGLVSYGYYSILFPNLPNPINELNRISKYYTTSISIEPRYYYNLKRRITKGKSANNLSGSYISVAFTGGFDYDILPENNYLGIENQIVGNNISQRWSQAAIKWGHQRRLFKNGFLDFSITPFWSGYSSIKTETGHVFKGFYTSDYFIADFKIGFAF